jgi:Mlc titration factor MtfA (ptsG expression regulator)
VNVVLHEFAHPLDLLDSAMDDARVLNSRAMYGEWAEILGAEFERLRGEVAQGIPSIISAYGATKPAEFFAVVTELFFERPRELRQQHPALYDEFKKYYGQDPAARLPMPRG